MKLALIIFVCGCLLFVIFLYFGQGRFIYFPRGYAPGNSAVNYVDPIRYQSGGKAQVAFLLQRASETPPERVWWIFGGNGSVALDWVGIVASTDPTVNHAYILFDYPGYGMSEGRPSPWAIRQSVDDAMAPLAETLGLSRGELTSRSATLGHSLGCAVALDTADRFGMRRVIAIAPFTTMKAMARRQMGGFGAAMLRHHYDNETAIGGLLADSDSGLVTIFHGEDDGLIPLSMGRSLAERDPSGERVEFIPVPDAGHSDIIGKISASLVSLLEQRAE